MPKASCMTIAALVLVALSTWAYAQGDRDRAPSDSFNDQDVMTVLANFTGEWNANATDTIAAFFSGLNNTSASIVPYAMTSFVNKWAAETYKSMVMYYTLHENQEEAQNVDAKAFVSAMAQKAIDEIILPSADLCLSS